MHGLCKRIVIDRHRVPSRFVRAIRSIYADYECKVRVNASAREHCFQSMEQEGVEWIAESFCESLLHSCHPIAWVDLISDACQSADMLVYVCFQKDK